MEGSLLSERISEIVQWFVGLYPSPDGFPYYEIDGNSGKPIGKRSLLAEFGDYVPFLHHCDSEAYVNEQYRLLEDRFSKQEPLFMRPVTRDHKGLGIRLPGGYTPSYTDFLDYTEILYGLMECWTTTSDERYLQSAIAVMEQVLRLFYVDGVICSWWLPILKRALPLTESLSGMIIEALLEIHRATGQEKYATIAVGIGNFWLNSSYFKKYGIFPSALILNRFLKKFPKFKNWERRAELCKANTSMVFGLFALYRHTKNSVWLEGINAWLEGMQSRFGADNGAYYQIGNLQMTPNPHRPILSTNFAILDLFCDLYDFTKEERFLESAMTLAEFWRRQQSPQTWLFPDSTDKPVSYIDGNTDFIVAFRKLYELTGEDRYSEAAWNALKGILTYHHCEFGYVREVNLHDGTVINSLVETRFVSLLLKVLLLFDREWIIYGPDGKLELLRDR